MTRQRPGYTPLAWIAIAAVAVIWASFSGAGHLLYANPDWRTRDAVYADLVLSAWPPSYGLHDGFPIVLRTAFGYFLPPAALSGLIGIELAPLVLSLWTMVGVALFLSLLPLPRQFGQRLLVFLLLIVCFSGMDYAGILLIHGHAPIFPLPLEWWQPWTYTSLTGQLLWAPNHAIALWIGTALIFRHRADPALPAMAVLLLPLLLLWTPFAVVGLLPWIFLCLVNLRIPFRQLLRGIGPAHWLAAIALTTAIISLFSRPGISLPYASADPAGQAVASGTGDLTDLALGYAAFVLFEFGLLAVLLRPKAADMKQAVLLASGLLLLLPLIRFGPSNDWLLRVSTPSLLVLMFAAMQELDVPWKDFSGSTRLVAISIVLGLGAPTPFFEFSRALLWARTAPNYGQNLADQQGRSFPAHYFGVLDRPLIRQLFRTPGPVPEGAVRAPARR